MRNCLWSLLFTSLCSFAQQSPVTTIVDAPWSSDLVHASTVEALRGPSSTGTFTVITGKSSADGVTAVRQSSPIDLRVDLKLIATSGAQSVTATLPGQSTAWTVTALRLTNCSAGTFVCEQPGKYRQALSLPYTVRAGHPAIITLSVGLGQKGSVTIGEDSVTVVGTITPPPPPPPPTTSGTSPDGTAIPPAAQIVDATGAVWALSGTRALKSGVDSGASGVVAILFKTGNIYIQQSGGSWWRYDPGGPWFVQITGSP